MAKRTLQTGSIQGPKVGVTLGSPGAQCPHEGGRGSEAESQADPVLLAAKMRRGHRPRTLCLWKPEKGGDGAPWGP